MTELDAQLTLNFLKIRQTRTASFIEAIEREYDKNKKPLETNQVSGSLNSEVERYSQDFEN